LFPWFHYFHPMTGASLVRNAICLVKFINLKIKQPSFLYDRLPRYTFKSSVFNLIHKRPPRCGTGFLFSDLSFFQAKKMHQVFREVDTKPYDETMQQ